MEMVDLPMNFAPIDLIVKGVRVETQGLRGWGWLGEPKVKLGMLQNTAGPGLPRVAVLRVRAVQLRHRGKSSVFHVCVIMCMCDWVIYCVFYLCLPGTRGR